jgi:hypothetical protein
MEGPLKSRCTIVAATTPVVTHAPAQEQQHYVSHGLGLEGGVDTPNLLMVHSCLPLRSSGEVTYKMFFSTTNLAAATASATTRSSARHASPLIPRKPRSEHCQFDQGRKQHPRFSVPSRLAQRDEQAMLFQRDWSRACSIGEIDLRSQPSGE